MVAEFHVVHDGFVDIPAEVYEDGGKLMIAIYSPEGGNPWEFPLADFVEAIGRAISILGKWHRPGRRFHVVLQPTAG